MASILLLKDHDGSKKGEVISVPFQVGKQLIAQGVGIPPAQKGEAKRPTAQSGNGRPHQRE